MQYPLNSIFFPWHNCWSQLIKRKYKEYILFLSWKLSFLVNLWHVSGNGGPTMINMFTPCNIGLCLNIVIYLTMEWFSTICVENKVHRNLVVICYLMHDYKSVKNLCHKVWQSVTKCDTLCDIGFSLIYSHASQNR